MLKKTFQKPSIITKKHLHSTINIQKTISVLYTNFFSKSVFNVIYESNRFKDFLYNIELEPIKSSELEHPNEKVVQPKYQNAKDISSEFYNGFGEDLYASF